MSPFEALLEVELNYETQLMDRGEQRGRQLAQLDAVLVSGIAGILIVGGSATLRAAQRLWLGLAGLAFMLSLGAAVVSAWPRPVAIPNAAALDILRDNTDTDFESQRRAVRNLMRERLTEVRRLAQRNNRALMVSYTATLVGMVTLMVPVALVLIHP